MQSLTLTASSIPILTKPINIIFRAFLQGTSTEGMIMQSA
jgi:hypothetical protein